MRIKNKEIRRRRHRKEQKIKDAARELRAQLAVGVKPAGAEKPAKPKAAPKKAPAKAAASDGAKAEKPKRTRTPKPKTETPAADAE